MVSEKSEKGFRRSITVRDKVFDNDKLAEDNRSIVSSNVN